MFNERIINEDLETVRRKLLSHESLIRKALKSVNLELSQDHTEWCSKPICSYPIEGAFLKALEKAGFVLDRRDDGIITIVDKNPQKKVEGWDPSNYWNFRNNEEEKDDLVFELEVKSHISDRERGVVLSPNVSGTFLSAADHLPQFRVFQVVAEFDKKADEVIKKIVKNEGFMVVGWASLGLGGIRSLRKLFFELTNNNEAQRELASSSMSPFNPSPYERATDNREFSLEEPLQPILFNLWDEQLKLFRNRF